MSWFHRLLGVPDPTAEQERRKDKQAIANLGEAAEAASLRVDRIVREYERAERRRLNQEEA